MDPHQKYRLSGKDSHSDSCKTDFVRVARPNTRRQEDVSSQLSSISELYVEHFNEHYKEIGHNYGSKSVNVKCSWELFAHVLIRTSSTFVVYEF